VKRTILVGLSAFIVLLPPQAIAAPVINLNRTIQTTPFTGTTIKMSDHEGSAYVSSNDSLWLADDDGDAIFEVDPGTGVLKRKIPQTDFNAAPLLGGGPTAGPNRTEDFESIAYDQNSDALYVFSGPCCSASNHPTAFRLVRVSGTFQVESHQRLPEAGANYTAAAWNAGDDTIYVGYKSLFRSFDYATGTVGPTFSVGTISGITGMDFSSSGTDLFVTTGAERLRRINWTRKSSGWNLDLRPFGVLDSRAVALVRGQYFVSDGAPRTGTLKNAVFVFDIT
jgi:hypothetical protein